MFNSLLNLWNCLFPRLYRKLHPRVNFPLFGTSVRNKSHLSSSTIRNRIYILNSLNQHKPSVIFSYKTNVKMHLLEGCTKSTMHRYNSIFSTYYSNSTLLNDKHLRKTKIVFISSSLNNVALVRSFFLYTFQS